MMDATQDRRRFASANVALCTAVAFVVVSALVSFASDRGAGPNAWSLRGALDAGSPLPAPVKPV